MKKTIFSLALGTFGLGMAEFGIMGVLPDMAHDVGISIPAAGNMIAWYAFGVVIGAPIHGAALQPVFPEIGDAVPGWPVYSRQYPVYLLQ
ncbi:MFS transport protein AraJ [Serratia liquefaciens]|nr:MFS transport protein AraJ [Serratia liquefaciens]